MKPLLCITCLCLILMISGCWDRKEINDLAFISGASGDLAEDGEVTVSFQIAIPTTSGKAGGDQQEKFFVISEKGKNATDVLQKLQKKKAHACYSRLIAALFSSARS